MTTVRVPKEYMIDYREYVPKYDAIVRTEHITWVKVDEIIGRPEKPQAGFDTHAQFIVNNNSGELIKLRIKLDNASDVYALLES